MTDSQVYNCDRQTDRQTDRHTDTQTHRHIRDRPKRDM